MKPILRRIGRAGCIALALFGPLPARAQASPEEGVLHGFVRAAETGEAIGFARLVIDGRISAIADRDGYFRIPRLQGGEHSALIRALGYAVLDTAVIISAHPIELHLRSAPVEIAGVVATATRSGGRDFETPEVSVRTVTPAEIDRVPAALESDVFRSLQALPGVISPGVASSQLLVRGGGADENLFLLDGYPVVHPYHLFGGFSTVPVEAVRDVELWTAAPPARHGGRLSSVVDIALRDGNREDLSGTASVGLVSSSAVVETPLPRGAVFVGARSTYLDLVTREFLDEEVPYRFYDAYLKSYIDLTPSDRISGLLFFGRDRLWTPETNREEFSWTNGVGGLSWRHLFGGKAVFEQRLSLSGFREHLQNGFSKLQVAQIRGENQIALAAARGELRLDLIPNHRLEVGYSAERQAITTRTAYFVPGYEEYPQLDLLFTERTADLPGIDTYALYAQDDVRAGEALRFRLGVRGEKGSTGWSLQPRLAAKYLWSDRLAFTAGAGLIRQQTHLVQDPDIGLGDAPVNIWLSADEPGIPTGRAVHIVGGVEAKLPYDVDLRAEGYRKEYTGLTTLTPYDERDRRFAIDRLESASGRAQGIDLSVTRQAPGPVRGWLGYSLASTTRTVLTGNFAADPHPRQRFIAVGDIDTGMKWGLTARFEAFEGIPFTPPVAIVQDRPFDFGRGGFLTGPTLPDDGFDNQCTLIGGAFLYGPRNSARTGWSKRLDLGTSRQWTDRRGWKWGVSVSVLNALFDPTGVFRPSVRASRDDLRPGCNAPVEVMPEREFTLPAIPSVSFRVEF